MNNNSNEEAYWINQNLFYYQDPSTSVQFCLSLDSGLFINSDYGPSHHVPRITFHMKDSREIPNGKIRFEMTYDNMQKFVSSSRKMVKWGEKECKNKGYQFTLQKIVSKSKKDLIVSVEEINNKLQFVIRIFDPLSNLNKASLFIDKEKYVNICQLVGSVCDQYVMLSMNSVSILNQQKLMTSMEKIEARLGSLNETLSKKTITSKNAENGNTTSSYDFSEDQFEPSEVQKTAMDFLSDDVIESTELSASFEPKEKKDVGLNSSIELIFDNDLTNLNVWSSALINAQEPDSISHMMTLSFIPNDEISTVISDDDMTKIETFLWKYVKRQVLEYTQGNEFPTDFPVIKFDRSIYQNECPKLYRMVQECMLVLLVYNLMFRTALNYIQTNNVNTDKIESYRTSYFVYKVICSSLFVSLGITDEEQFIDDVVKLFIDADADGAFDTLKQVYSDIAMGGELNLSPEMIDKTVRSFLKILSSSSVYGIKYIDNLMDEYDLLEREKQYDSPEYDLEEPTVEDDRLKVYLSIVKKISDYQFTDLVSTYDDLSELLSRSPDAPDEVFIVKRIMDINSTEMNQAKLEKLVNEFSEDINVTRSRVISNETVEEVDDFFPDF